MKKVCTEFALALFAGLGALGGFRIVSKKWTDQCEAEEKKGHCYSRAFFLKRKTRRLKMREFLRNVEANRKIAIFQTLPSSVSQTEVSSKLDEKRDKFALAM